MFDIGFGELALVFVIGLVVLGPERLPVAVRTVVGWIKALRALASTVQNELSQELKLQELQESLKKVEQASKDNLSPELKASMEELRDAANSMKKSFNSKMVPDDQPNTIHNPLINEPEAIHDGVTPAQGASQADAPPMAPPAAHAQPEPAAAEPVPTSIEPQPEPPTAAKPVPTSIDAQPEPAAVTRPAPTAADARHETSVTTQPAPEHSAVVPTSHSHNDR